MNTETTKITFHFTTNDDESRRDLMFKHVTDALRIHNRNHEFLIDQSPASLSVSLVGHSGKEEEFRGPLQVIAFIEAVKELASKPKTKEVPLSGDVIAHVSPSGGVRFTGPNGETAKIISIPAADVRKLAAAVPGNEKASDSEPVIDFNTTLIYHHGNAPVVKANVIGMLDCIQGVMRSSLVVVEEIDTVRAFLIGSEPHKVIEFYRPCSLSAFKDAVFKLIEESQPKTASDLRSKHPFHSVPPGAQEWTGYIDESPFCAATISQISQKLASMLPCHPNTWDTKRTDAEDAFAGAMFAMRQMSEARRESWQFKAAQEIRNSITNRMRFGSMDQMGASELSMIHSVLNFHAKAILGGSLDSVAMNVFKYLDKEIDAGRVDRNNGPCDARRDAIEEIIRGRAETSNEASEIRLTDLQYATIRFLNGQKVHGAAVPERDKLVDAIIHGLTSPKN